jgi:DDE superfamily endonuclease./Tc5 transposase DNA-binding domain.
MWVVQQEAQGVKMTGEVIKEKGRQFAELYDILAEKFLTLSNGWLDGFKARHLLKEYWFHGEAGSILAQSVAAACKKLQIITAHYPKKDIYNMDEMGLCYYMHPDCSLVTKQMAGVKGDKTRVTIAFTTNADGSDIWQPLFTIGYARKPHCFNKRNDTDFGFDYHWNKKAWMTGLIFQKCIVSTGEEVLT